MNANNYNEMPLNTYQNAVQKIMTTPNIGENEENLDPTYISGGNIKC